MGNTFGGKRSAKVMQVSGETFKLKTPVQAGQVVKDFPGHVLLKSQEVKHFGVRAKPLEPYQQLEPNGIYFLVELPKSVQKQQLPRRVQSGINMSAKDRLESLMLSKRSVSDLSAMKLSNSERFVPEEGTENGPVRVRMRLPKAEVEKLMRQSRDEAEAAEKIVDLCMVKNNNGGEKRNQVHWKDRNERLLGSQGKIKTREKRVSFRPANQAEIQIAVDS